MSGNLVESLIGAVVLAVAGAFLYMVYTATDVGATGGYPLKAQFQRVGGLQLGADVRMAGIKVGTVTDQRLDPQTYQAVVRFTVDPSIELPEDSSASITSSGLLGESYLKLQPGGSPQMLEPGDEVEFTEDAIDIWSLISQAMFSSGGSGDGNGGQAAGNGAP